MINEGFYFCHSFDVGTRLEFFENYLKRESLTSIPNALRYQNLKHKSLNLWINELGFLIAFQPLQNVDSLSKAYSEYRNNFESHYATVLQEVESVVNKPIEAETSFVVYLGSQEMVVDWKAVHIPNNDISKSILLEALFIDQICRTIDDRSRSFVEKTSLAEERLVVEYVENLFPLAIPAGFLVAKDEIDQMKKYYSAWQLSERVAAIRGRFAESVTNTALYRGHLNRHSQSAMNFLLTAIAILSLAQVSKAISDTLLVFTVFITQDELNKIFAIIAFLLLAWGILRHILYPSISLWFDDAKRKFVSWQILRKRN